jgi:hypothetical protein
MPAFDFVLYNLFFMQLERLQADYGVETMLVITRGNINADRFTKAHTSQKCASFLKSIVRTDANRLAEQIEGYVISGAANQGKCGGFVNYT